MMASPPYDPSADLLAEFQVGYIGPQQPSDEHHHHAVRMKATHLFLQPWILRMSQAAEDEPDDVMLPINEVSNQEQRRKTIAQFVTTIRNPEAQIGQHIIQALQHDDTVAVLTTVTLGPDGQQRIVSAALDPERMKMVQEILIAAEEEREQEEPCIGFHCLIKPKS